MKHKYIWIIFLAGFLLISTYAEAENGEKEQKKSHIYSTWESFEADKCASLWLIKHFIDKKAIFQFYAKASKNMPGTLIDVPEATLRRQQNLSTYESIRRHYQLNDPKLIYIGRIIHDIEINVWEEKAFALTYQVQRDMAHIILNSTSPKDIISKSNAYFDQLYQQVPD